tara:strand:- start:38246 stop:38662 length:417 start_codon:yes stop_codon:yes gene_type:complete
MKCYQTRPRKRRGTAAVEFAVVAPIMLLFTFGLVELGRMMLVKQSATHATREGARIAIRPTATNDDVLDRVNEELALFAINDAVVETIPPSIEDMEPGLEVKVRITIDPAANSWVPGFFDWAIPDMVAESSMRRESTN